MINYRIKHIGINHPNAEEASKTAELFRNCFQLERTGGTAPRCGRLPPAFWLPGTGW